MSFVKPTLAVRGTWSVGQAFLVCDESKEHLFKDLAPVLNRDEHWWKVTSVQMAVDELNSDKLKCPGGVGLVHSTLKKEIYCIYRSDKKELAFEKFLKVESSFIVSKVQGFVSYWIGMATSLKSGIAHEYSYIKKEGPKKFAREKLKDAQEGWKKVDKTEVKVVAAAAAGGAVTGGAGGGAVGLPSGAVIGAVIGIIPALFTFGLSIPIGAVVGGATGLVVGTTVGGSTGFVGGGVAGYVGYESKAKIKNAHGSFKTTAGSYVTALQQRLVASKTFVKSKFVSGTGGTTA